MVIPDPKFIFFNNCTAASVVNPNGTKILSAYSVSTFFINDNASLTGGPNKLKLPSSWLINHYVETFSPENSSHVKKSWAIYVHSKAFS